MEAPSPRYILTRAAFLIAALVALMYGFSFFKKYQRKSEIVSELKSISSDSSFFQQFYPEDARKTLVRAIGLIAEAKQLGMPPDKSIDRGLGVEAKFFETDSDKDEPPVKMRLIRTTLRSNYENFVKLGYTADFRTLNAMKEGSLPGIPSGPDHGKIAVILPLIDPALSPGLDKVLANLEIRPPSAEGRAPTDMEIAAAKGLARDLALAGLIEDGVRDKIVTSLSAPAKK